MNRIFYMILERYYSYIKNYKRDDGSSFMENVYGIYTELEVVLKLPDKCFDIFTSILPQNNYRGKAITLIPCNTTKN